MFERFTKDARRVVSDATDIARGLGAPSVEAEHLLLAASRLDSRLGLDHETLLSALELETERSLAAVGVSADALSFSPYVETPRLATSAKVALEQSLRIAV